MPTPSGWIGDNRTRPQLLSAAMGRLLPYACILVLMLCLAGCSSADDAVSTTSANDAPSAATSVASTPSSTSTPTSVSSGQYKATSVVEGLAVPWEMRFLPDGRLLVTEREGRVVLADVTTGAVTEVGQIEVLARGEGGLLGLALDPDFPEVSAIYVSYTHAQNDKPENRVSRIELAGVDTATPRLGQETVLLDGIPAGTNHNGSRVAFDPDGYLWVTTGDAGDRGLAQQMDSLAGKVLRMTKEGKAAPDNPFGDRPYPFSLIYTLGHRNVQGLAFHPQTGFAYVTEHGPSDNDEINRLHAGADYGWPELRGIANKAGFVDPIVTWSPTIAPAGAVFYSGSPLSDLDGTFVFVTLKESDLRVLVPGADDDFGVVAQEQVLFDGQFGRLRAIAVGPDGALYMATSNLDGRGTPRSGDDRIIRVAPRP